MALFSDIAVRFESFVPIARTIVVVIILFVLLGFITSTLRKHLLKKAKTRQQIANMELFLKMAKYTGGFIIFLSALLSYSGSLAGIGITVGFVSVILGWTLQRPITGMAAWLMIAIRRPFQIGDRVIIGLVKGDVIDITLTHIYLKEVGGIVNGEEPSGRMIMIPNSILFEQNIINYMYKNDYVLDKVSFMVTHDSDLDEACGIAVGAAKKYVGSMSKESKTPPYCRTFFKGNGVSVHVRYVAPAQELQRFSSEITKEINELIMRAKQVKFVP